MVLNFDHEKFRQKLLNWWEKNKRDFPWRKTRNPYHILVSEMLLHRTRADQVVPIYVIFLKKFPTIKDLASAPMEEVEKILFPLGLHWRAKNLHKTANSIVKNHDGRIPSEREELEALPGVSQYIASAVRCFAFGYPEVLLDTNTVRIVGRIFGLKITDGSRRSKHFRNILQHLIDRSRPREFNYALLDLGALVCKAQKPLCNICPISDMCRYGKEGGNKK